MKAVDSTVFIEYEKADKNLFLLLEFDPKNVCEPTKGRGTRCTLTKQFVYFLNVGAKN
jgi:hypothetical protein